MIVSHRLAAASLAAALFAAEVDPAYAQTAGSSSTIQEPASTSGSVGDERFAIHMQTTSVLQGHGTFRSPYQGPNSLGPRPQARETWDVTLYAGAKLWRGAELWVNPEIDQGFGLSETLGVAGFPNGEAYKVGKASPYFRLQRAFFRQTINLGGERETVDADLNQLAGSRTSDRLVLTVGKFSVGDIFDTNRYAHDPHADFLNWTIIDAATFDYAADAWGYSAGGAAEWYQGRWTMRGGAFLLSNVPNSTKLDTRFEQFQLIGELEERHTIAGRPGKVRVTGYVSRGRMAKLDDATALGAATGQPADPALVRRFASRPGVSINLEQEIADDLGVFARAGWADGRYETYEFTDVDRSVSGGISLAGRRWKRADDGVGLAAVVNMASDARLRFLDAGGLGILIGDGRLPRPGDEWSIESYYKVAIRKGVHVTIDYQRVTNPGYNTDRGPVNIFTVRLHGQF